MPIVTATRDVAFTVSGGDVLALFILAPVALVAIKFVFYFVLAVSFSGGVRSVQLAEWAFVIGGLLLTVTLGYGVWEFSHWIVRE